MRSWTSRLCRLLRGTCPSQRSIVVQFTGEPPRTPIEKLIRTIAGDLRLVALDAMEQQLADALYKAELRRGAWVLDIGTWGPSLYGAEAARLLRQLRGDFALLAETGESVAPETPPIRTSARSDCRA